MFDDQNEPVASPKSPVASSPARQRRSTRSFGKQTAKMSATETEFYGWFFFYKPDGSDSHKYPLVKTAMRSEFSIGRYTSGSEYQCDVLLGEDKKVIIFTHDNNTTINNERVEMKQRVVLKEGDMIGIGDRKFRYTAVAAAHLSTGPIGTSHRAVLTPKQTDKIATPRAPALLPPSLQQSSTSTRRSSTSASTAQSASTTPGGKRTPVWASELSTAMSDSTEPFRDAYSFSDNDGDGGDDELDFDEWSIGKHLLRSPQRASGTSPRRTILSPQMLGSPRRLGSPDSDEEVDEQPQPQTMSGNKKVRRESTTKAQQQPSSPVRVTPVGVSTPIQLFGMSKIKKTPTPRSALRTGKRSPKRSPGGSVLKRNVLFNRDVIVTPIQKIGKKSYYAEFGPSAGTSSFDGDSEDDIVEDTMALPRLRSTKGIMKPATPVVCSPQKKPVKTPSRIPVLAKVRVSPKSKKSPPKSSKTPTPSKKSPPKQTKTATPPVKAAKKSVSPKKKTPTPKKTYAQAVKAKITPRSGARKSAMKQRSATKKIVTPKAAPMSRIPQFATSSIPVSRLPLKKPSGASKTPQPKRALGLLPVPVVRKATSAENVGKCWCCC